MYESRRQPLISRAQFHRRLVQHGIGVMSLIAVSVLAGMVGYVSLENLSWLDAFLNSSMLLGGMGPVDMPKTPGGKLFAGTGCTSRTNRSSSRYSMRRCLTINHCPSRFSS